MLKRVALMLCVTAAALAISKLNGFPAEAAALQSEAVAPAEESAQPLSSAETEESTVSAVFLSEQSPAEEAAESEEADDADDAAESVTVTWLDGDELLSTEAVPAGSAPAQSPSLTADGRPIWGWLYDGALTGPETLTVSENISLTALAAPEISTETHTAFISPSSTGLFRPTESLTRAEAAAMLLRLLGEVETGPVEWRFADVSEDVWYYDTLSTLTSLGVFGLSQQESFRPEAAMTRAEFVALMVRFFPEQTGEVPFSDVPETHWAYDEIASACAYGWLSGYDDGTFHPDEAITRADAVSCLLKILGRTTEGAQTAAQLQNLNAYADVVPGDSWYAAVTEASTVHSYELSDGAEVWTEFSYTVSGLEPGLHQIGSSYYHVDENGQFDRYSPGLAEIDGKYYLVADDGTIPVLSAGTRIFGDDLYYVYEDGSVAINYTDGYLSFGADGAYTTGSEELDALVKEALSQCTTSDMTASERLYAAYLYLRDNCTYLNRTHCARGTTSWATEYATWMFTYHKGNCYCYAAAFMYMARQLGYQAQVVSGGVGSGIDHGWVMIDGLIYDPELEYAYRYRYATRRYYNLFGMSPNATPFSYYFPY